MDYIDLVQIISATARSNQSPKTFKTMAALKKFNSAGD